MSSYCSVAILKYLDEGDRHAFFECCYNAAACFDVHNRYCLRGMPHERTSYSLVNPVGLFYGFLSVSRDLAANLAWGIHPKCRYGEDDDQGKIYATREDAPDIKRKTKSGKNKRR
jgi:hypothetical protein